MRTQFTPDKLRDPGMAQSEHILRACVHCGFCNATCPTYLITGDENDGPRGRIYLIREMLQSKARPDARTVAHIDSCLSCLGCATTCPSGVDYMRLVDHARAHIETRYPRPLWDRGFRALLNFILPHPARFGLALRLGRSVAPFAKVFPARLRRMLTMIPPHQISLPFVGWVGVGGETKTLRVALLTGCVQPSLAPEINAATIRLLNRLGIEVIPQSAGCCGAISHHLGKAEAAKQFARANIAAWMAEPLDAIIVNATGCGTQVKEYAHLLREDPGFAKPAAQISAITKDISEFLLDLGMPEPVQKSNLKVAYHSACSAQHGQKLGGKVEALLKAAGFTVLIPRDAHLCCGAAGSYTLLQPEMSQALAARKTETLAALKPDVIATGNIGCQLQIAAAFQTLATPSASPAQTPVLHWVQLLDWAHGGPRPLTNAQK